MKDIQDEGTTWNRLFLPEFYYLQKFDLFKHVEGLSENVVILTRSDGLCCGFSLRSQSGREASLE